MLGTEYNWLISISHPTDGLPRARLARTGLLTLAVAVFCFLCVSVNAEPAHRVLMREATAAAMAGDTVTVIAKLEAARAARPDYPRVLNNLARYYLQAGRADEAMAQLRELAAMGLQVNVAGDEAFATLRERADFAALAAAFAANRAAVGLDEGSRRRLPGHERPLTRPGGEQPFRFHRQGRLGPLRKVEGARPRPHRHHSPHPAGLR